MEMTSAKSARQCVVRHSLSTNFPGKGSRAKIFTRHSYIFPDRTVRTNEARAPHNR